MPFYAIESWEEAERLLVNVPEPPRGPFIIPTALGLAVAEAAAEIERRRQRWSR